MSEVQTTIKLKPLSFPTCLVKKYSSPNDDESICATSMFDIKFLQIRNPCFSVFMLQIGLEGKGYCRIASPKKHRSEASL